jgi:hypothetical protein
MFCAVYQKFGDRPVGLIRGGDWTAQDTYDRIDEYLTIANYRYTLYLDLLVSVKDNAKETWPLPPW